MKFDISKLNGYSYDYLLNSCLERLPKNVDKREGSIIYDAIAPLCYMLAQGFIAIEQLLKQTHPFSAEGKFLDNKAADFNIYRKNATKAYRKGYFEVNSAPATKISIGSRFSTIIENNPVNYSVVSSLDNGFYMLECEQAGTIGNEYFGDLLMLTSINSLTKAELLDITIPGTNQEQDKQLRQRLYDHISKKFFGGNIADYNKFTTEIAGVGACQIYPTWKGGGTVLVSILDSTFTPPTLELVNMVQNLIDPKPQGLGLGTAPIGHTVTVKAADIFIINLAITITLDTSTNTITNIRQFIEEAIDNYFLQLKRTWGIPVNKMNNYKLTISYFNIGALLLNIPGVIALNDLKLNGDNLDVQLQQSPLTQQIPKLGEVIINEA